MGKGCPKGIINSMGFLHREIERNPVGAAKSRRGGPCSLGACREKRDSDVKSAGIGFRRDSAAVAGAQGNWKKKTVLRGMT